jgi:hypothetical protein
LPNIRINIIICNIASLFLAIQIALFWGTKT